MFIKRREKKSQKGIGKITHNLWIEKGVWEIYEKKPNEPNKNDQVQRSCSKYRNRIHQQKMEKERRDEVNEGTMQQTDNIADINDDNVDINQADSANEEPIKIIENELSDCERNWLLRLREAFQGDDFGKTEKNLKYGDEEEYKEQVV